MSTQWIKCLPAFSSTNNSFLFMTFVIGSYDQLFFVICDLLCAYFHVVSLYYRYPVMGRVLKICVQIQVLHISEVLLKHKQKHYC